MKTNIYSGKFIVFEGLDGSGQSTQVSLLGDFLSKSGHHVILTKEPTMDSEAGKEIRKALDEKVKLDSLELQKLFVQDRKEHLDKLIIPALDNGLFVISDRYFFSTFAFGVSDGLDLDELINMNDNFILPDITILLKVNPKVCIERIEKRGEGVKLFEKEQKLAKVWQTYSILPDRFKNIHMIDGEKPIKEVFKKVKEIMLPMIG